MCLAPRSLWTLSQVSNLLLTMWRSAKASRWNYSVGREVFSRIFTTDCQCNLAYRFFQVVHPKMQFSCFPNIPVLLSYSTCLQLSWLKSESPGSRQAINGSIWDYKVFTTSSVAEQIRMGVFEDIMFIVHPCWFQKEFQNISKLKISLALRAKAEICFTCIIIIYKSYLLNE